MSNPVTREEFDSLVNKVSDLAKEIKDLSTNITNLVLEIRTMNASSCKDVEFMKEKIETLQDFKADMYKRCEEFNTRFTTIETTAIVTKDNLARWMGIIGFIMGIIGAIIGWVK